MQICGVVVVYVRSPAIGSSKDLIHEKNVNQFGVEIHKKFSLAVACLLFVLVGSPLGIMIKKGGISIAAGLSIAFFLVYYILLIWGEQMADRGLMSPALGMWTPNIFLAIGIAFLPTSEAILGASSIRLSAILFAICSPSSSSIVNFYLLRKSGTLSSLEPNFCAINPAIVSKY